jgi:polar amino acid transport system substrate-binding protein
MVCVGLLAAFSSTPARGDALDQIRQRGTLIWGADQEGGGPYVYPDPQRDGRVIGFEVDLAELIAQELGVKAQLFQGDWDTLPQFLHNSQCDIILNGYELTPERAAQMSPSKPYYLYQLQLLARQNETRIRGWSDLATTPPKGKWIVGALEGSAAATYLRDHFPDTVDVRAYDGNTNSMAAVRNGTDDATLQDSPIALFYSTREQGQGLKFVGEPVAPGYYVIYGRLGEDRLMAAINKAIDRAYVDGRLQAILDKYIPRRAVAVTSQPAQVISGWAVVSRYASTLIRAAGMTVFLSVTSMPIAILVGLLVALGRMYGPPIIRVPLTLYVEVLRGTPIMLQLFVIYFLLPRILPFGFNPIQAAIMGLAINYSAYEAEIYRAGLQAIPVGQMDAALALGMRRSTALRRVIVPQAIRIVIPPVTNDFIALFKDTSVCSVIAVTELTKEYNVLANSTGAVIELAAMTALLYMIMSYPLSLVTRRLETQLARPRSE